MKQVRNPVSYTHLDVYKRQHLKNALISNNKSNGQGAGIASCPISKTKIYINDGVALYGNESGTIGNELFLYSRCV